MPEAWGRSAPSVPEKQQGSKCFGWKELGRTRAMRVYVGWLINRMSDHLGLAGPRKILKKQWHAVIYT